MTKFNGLIQHSFALRLDTHQPFDGHSTRETVAERFNALVDGDRQFCVAPLEGGGRADDSDPVATNTLLARTDLTTVRPRPVGMLCDSRPRVFSWAGPGEKPDQGGSRPARPQMIFAEFEEKYGRISENDFLVEAATPDAEEKRSGEVAQSLLEAVAFRRSQLFGLAIANRFVNVMLPCATLTPVSGPGDDLKWMGGHLLLLPLVSLMRDGGNRRAFRRMYTLTLYALPVKLGEEWRARKMGRREIASIANAGWSLADAIPQKTVPRYEVGGPLHGYVTSLARPGATALLDQAKAEGALSFRKVSELVAFGVALRMAQGPRGQARKATRSRIGDDVVTTLSTARVSAVLLVDPNLKRGDLRKPIRRRDPPGSLKRLMKTLAGGARAPKPWTASMRRKYTLDRPFVDSESYAAGILPTNRCLLVTYMRKTERTDPVPLLSLVAGVTFMTVGTATAIGTLRSIDRSLERLERENPRKIAEIDAEIATDLHEIYDLDIARETYRNLYRRLRKRLGIIGDYETLQDKMQTLYRATATFHDEKEQKQLAWLTAAIVFLSVLILIGTIVVATKPN